MTDKTIDDYRASHEFTDAQLTQITLGLTSNIDVEFYADPQISADDMSAIVRGLTRGRDMTTYKRLSLPDKRIPLATSHTGHRRRVTKRLVRNIAGFCSGICGWLLIMSSYCHLGDIATRILMLTEMAFIVITVHLYRLK